MITEQEQPPKVEGEDRGISLLSRDTPENRAKWGEEGVGYEQIAASVCVGGDNGDEKCPYYNYQHDATHENALLTPIHLLIASFRDVLCPRTLHNAFTRAENPHRIYIRIIDQHEPDSDLPDDAGCWDRYCKDYNTNCSEFKDNVQTVVRDAATAQGPTDARSKLSAMIYWDYVHGNDPTLLDFHPVAPEDFCMETDSHMDFSDNFDTGLIAMHHRTKNDFAVLSTYVASMEQNNQDPPYVPK
jgi:Glycosyltransferase (GlcNAc)